MGCSSIHGSLWGRVVGLVCLCTQPILFGKHLQYKPTVNAIIPSDVVKLPMVENAFTFSEEQKLVAYALSYVHVLLILWMTFVSSLGFYELNPVICHQLGLLDLMFLLG